MALPAAPNEGRPQAGAIARAEPKTGTVSARAAPHNVGADTGSETAIVVEVIPNPEPNEIVGAVEYDESGIDKSAFTTGT